MDDTLIRSMNGLALIPPRRPRRHAATASPSGGDGCLQREGAAHEAGARRRPGCRCQDLMPAGAPATPPGEVTHLKQMHPLGHPLRVEQRLAGSGPSQIRGNTSSEQTERPCRHASVQACSLAAIRGFPAVHPLGVPRIPTGPTLPPPASSPAGGPSRRTECKDVPPRALSGTPEGKQAMEQATRIVTGVVPSPR